ncbi:MAG: hypothetical protein ACJLS2_14845 [Microcella pacifica]
MTTPSDSASRSDPIRQAERRAEPVLRLAGVSKSYPGVQALNDVDLDVWGGSATQFSVRTAPANPR